MPVVYILECFDRTLYVGRTSDLDARVAAHNDGTGAAYTAARRPVRLLYSEPCASELAAAQRERQLKGSTVRKKEALIAGDTPRLESLGERRRRQAGS